MNRNGGRVDGGWGRRMEGGTGGEERREENLQSGWDVKSISIFYKIFYITVFIEVDFRNIVN